MYGKRKRAPCPSCHPCFFAHSPHLLTFYLARTTSTLLFAVTCSWFSSFPSNTHHRLPEFVCHLPMELGIPRPAHCGKPHRFRPISTIQLPSTLFESFPGETGGQASEKSANFCNQIDRSIDRFIVCNNACSSSAPTRSPHDCTFLSFIRGNNDHLLQAVRLSTNP